MLFYLFLTKILLKKRKLMVYLVENGVGLIYLKIFAFLFLKFVPNRLTSNSIIKNLKASFFKEGMLSYRRYAVDFNFAFGAGVLMGSNQI